MNFVNRMLAIMRYHLKFLANRKIFPYTDRFTHIELGFVCVLVVWFCAFYFPILHAIAESH